MLRLHNTTIHNQNTNHVSYQQSTGGPLLCCAVCTCTALSAALRQPQLRSRADAANW
jgi:hypothetical protein